MCWAVGGLQLAPGCVSLSIRHSFPVSFPLSLFVCVCVCVCERDTESSTCSGAVDEQNKMPWYAEQCPSMLAVTYSNGIGDRTIVTTDVSKHSGCTTKFTGTSAAAPIASGIIALVLQVRYVDVIILVSKLDVNFVSLPSLNGKTVAGLAIN